MTTLAKGWTESEALASSALNPGEVVLWQDHCLSRLGRQAKTPAGPERSPLGCFVVFVATAAAAIAGVLLTGSGAGAFVFFPAAILSAWLVEKLSRGPDTPLYCRKQTVYVLTNQRAFVLRNCNCDVPVQSLPLRFVDEVRAEGVRPDGRGSVQFLSWDQHTRQWTRPLRFHMIERPGAVVQAARTALAAQGSVGPDGSGAAR